MTTAEQLAQNAGTDIRTVARHWPTYRPGLSEKQVRNRITRINRVLRTGKVGYHAALQLTALLDCDFNSLQGLAEARGTGGKRVSDTNAPGAATGKFNNYELRDMNSGLKEVKGCQTNQKNRNTAA